MKKKYSRVGLPEKFLERLPAIVDEAHLSDVIVSFAHKKPTTFRANILKISAPDLKNELEKLGFVLRRVDWYLDAFILVSPTQKELMLTRWYLEGFLYIQSLSSMIPALILNPKPDDLVCDLTAAPGSKTTQMAAIMQSKGKIVANDKSNIRLLKLKANLRLQGVTNVEVTQQIGKIFWRQYPEQFDKTLVDVPCSMEGRFYTEDPKTFRDWTMNKIRYLEEVQRFLLRSAVSATKPGGAIVYSTCTLAPEENEGVIDWILKKEGRKVVVESINLEKVAVSPGFTQWGQKQYCEDIVQTGRILPSNVFEGFYIAKLRKLQSTVYNPELKQVSIKKTRPQSQGENLTQD